MFEFSFGSFMFGFVVLIVGVLLTAFHQKIADAVMSGISSYDKARLWGLIISGVGLAIIFGIHTVILRFLFGSLFG